MDQQTKNKIAQCLALSMEIEGAIFYHQSDCGCVRVYKIVDGEHEFIFTAWHNQDLPDTLDKLIKDLSNHINTENLNNG